MRVCKFVGGLAVTKEQIRRNTEIIDSSKIIK